MMKEFLRLLQEKILFVFTAVINPVTAPIDIIPSTPRLRIPDFSVINSPSEAINKSVAACNVAFSNPRNCTSTIISSL